MAFHIAVNDLKFAGLPFTDRKYSKGGRELNE